jgi:hypothetical protein
MAKSSARKTADAIHNIPEYFGPQVDEPADGMKKGDIWFESDGTRREAPQSKPLPKRDAQLKRVEKTLKKRTGKLPTRTKEIKKLRRR